MSKKVKMVLGEILTTMGVAILVCGHFLVENTPKYKWTDAFEAYTEILPFIGWMLLIIGALDIIIALCSSDKEKENATMPSVHNGNLTKACPGCGLMVAEHIEKCPNCKTNIKTLQ